MEEFQTHRRAGGVRGRAHGRARDHHGTMEGALRSGVRAAMQVLEIVS
jgi:monoamine oxidase